MNKAELKKLDRFAAHMQEAVEWLQELHQLKDEQLDNCSDTERGEARREALEEDIGFIEEVTTDIENVLYNINEQTAVLYQ